MILVYTRTATRPKLRRTDRLVWVWLTRVPRALDQALRSASGGPSTDQRRDRRPRQSNGRDESLVGCSPNPWRTHEARHRGSRADRRLADPQATLTALPALARVPHQPCPGPRRCRFLHGAPAGLRRLFVLVVFVHHRRRVVHFDVTEHPTAHWTAQQIVDAFPDDAAPSHLLRDRDKIYGHAFRQRVKGMQIREVLTATRCPWQNPFTEWLIGSIRRECLDHALVFGEFHLRRILTRYCAYYHRARTHLALQKDAPNGRPIERPDNALVDVGRRGTFCLGFGASRA